MQCPFFPVLSLGRGQWCLTACPAGAALPTTGQTQLQQTLPPVSKQKQKKLLFEEEQTGRCQAVPASNALDGQYTA